MNGKKLEKMLLKMQKKHETKYKKILSNFKNFKSLKNLIEKTKNEYLKKFKNYSNQKII